MSGSRSSFFLIILTFTFSGFNSYLLVIFLEGSKILSGFGEFTFFHTLTDVPMNESSFGVHEIEFMIDSGEDLSDGGGVGDHADSSHNFSKITSWDDGWWLVIDTTFESGWAPVDELDGSLGFDGSNGGVDIFGDNITSVHHAAGHVFTVSGVAFGHHGGGFESGVGDLSNGELFMVSFLSRDDWGVG